MLLLSSLVVVGIFTLFLVGSLVLEQQRYDSLAKRYEDAATRVAAIEVECATRKAKRHSIDLFLNSLLKSDAVVSEFSQTLWNAAVDHATVSDAARITFTFRNQMEITIEI